MVRTKHGTRTSANTSQLRTTVSFSTSPVSTSPSSSSSSSSSSVFEGGGAIFSKYSSGQDKSESGMRWIKVWPLPKTDSGSSDKRGNREKQNPKVIATGMLLRSRKGKDECELLKDMQTNIAIFLKIKKKRTWHPKRLRRHQWQSWSKSTKRKRVRSISTMEPSRKRYRPWPRQD
jgi:hypothetical protein